MSSYFIEIPVVSGSSGVSSVNTRTGAVVLSKSDVGLSNVDNTSDLSKPISTLTQTALNAKLSKGVNTIFCIDNGDFATGQAAIDAATAGSTILFGAKSGGWGDLVIPAGKKLSLIGMQTERSIYVKFGSITFSPTTGTQILENELYLESLYMVVSSGTALTFGGTAPGRIRVNNCYIEASGTARCIVMNNSNAASSGYLNETTIISGSSATITQSSIAYAREYRTTIDGVSLGLQLDSGTFEQSMSNYVLNYTGNVVNISGGTLLAGQSLFANSGANSSGVAVATGAVFGSSYNTFAIPTGSGYCVRGAGVHASTTNNYSNSALLAYNVKVQNTLTNVAYTTAYTLSP
jgi:hypothetical protein